LNGLAVSLVAPGRERLAGYVPRPAQVTVDGIHVLPDGAAPVPAALRVTSRNPGILLSTVAIFAAQRLPASWGLQLHIA
jgi:hypothetical protein